MRPTREEAQRALEQGLEGAALGRVELARELVQAGAAEAVAIADLGRDTRGPVTRSLVVQARTAATASLLLRRLARGPLPELDRADLPARSPAVITPGAEALRVDPTLLGPELRIVRADPVTVHGWVALFARPGSSGVPRAWRVWLRRVHPALEALLDRTRAPFPGVEGWLAVDPEGRLLSADAGAGAWLGERGRAERLPTLLRLGREGDAVEGPLDGARVMLRAGRGAIGETWLGALASPSPLDRALDRLLTPAQRAVADQLVLGATCGEIASALGVRLETVRSHVRDIYTRLGIASRAELAARWTAEREASVAPSASARAA